MPKKALYLHKVSEHKRRPIPRPREFKRWTAKRLQEQLIAGLLTSVIFPHSYFSIYADGKCMIYGLKGIIFKEEVTNIVLNVNNVFYSIKITAPTNKEEGDELFLFTHQIIRQEEEYLVGFQSLGEKELFLKLINVSGIGPKTALGNNDRNDTKLIWTSN